MKKTQKNTTKSQPVNKEAFKMLATEIGLNEACRRLGVPIPTGKSWARRGGWKLPKRTAGRPARSLPVSSASNVHPASKLHPESHPIAEVLDATHQELAEQTKTALMQTLAKAAQQVAGRDALDVSNTAQLRDICLAAARTFGWDGKPSTQVNVGVQTNVTAGNEQRLRVIMERDGRLNGEDLLALGMGAEESRNLLEARRMKDIEQLKRLQGLKARALSAQDAEVVTEPVQTSEQQAAPREQERPVDHDLVPEPTAKKPEPPTPAPQLLQLPPHLRTMTPAEVAEDSARNSDEEQWGVVPGLL